MLNAGVTWEVRPPTMTFKGVIAGQRDRSVEVDAGPPMPLMSTSMTGVILAVALPLAVSVGSFQVSFGVSVPIGLNAAPS